MTAERRDPLEWGSFALVAYVPEPLGSFLNSLMHYLPGDEKPHAHITVLPPRPLRAPLDETSRAAKNHLERATAFPVELTTVKTLPETNLLYLAIGEGNKALHVLHDALNVGILSHEENFDFLPHLTISGTIAADHLTEERRQVQRAWKEYSAAKTFKLNEVDALWQPPAGLPSDWTRIWSQKLLNNGNSVSARSGH